MDAAAARNRLAIRNQSRRAQLRVSGRAEDQMKEHQLPSNYRVSLKALIRGPEGKILMVKEGSNDWGIPGGGLDHGESIEEGLRREVREELGTEIAIWSPSPVWVAPYYY